MTVEWGALSVMVVLAMLVGNSGNLKAQSTAVTDLRLVATLKRNGRSECAFSKRGDYVACHEFVTLSILRWPDENQEPELVASKSVHGLSALEFTDSGQLMLQTMSTLVSYKLNDGKLEQVDSVSVPHGRLLSVDGQAKYAVLVNREDFQVLDLPAGDATRQYTQRLYPGAIIEHRVSQDGQQVMFLQSDRLSIWDIAKEQVVETIQLPFQKAVRLSDDARYAFGNTADRKTIRLDLKTGESREVPPALVYSPDGKWAISVAGNRNDYQMVFQSLESGDKSYKHAIAVLTNMSMKIYHHPTKERLVVTSPFSGTMFFEYSLADEP